MALWQPACKFESVTVLLRDMAKRQFIQIDEHEAERLRIIAVG